MHARNLPTVFTWPMAKTDNRVMTCSVIGHAMNVGFCLHKVNIRPTDIVGASVLCGGVGKALSWISVSCALCLCLCLC